MNLKAIMGVALYLASHLNTGDHVMEISEAIRILKQTEVDPRIAQKFFTGVAILSKYAELEPIGNDSGVLFCNIFERTLPNMPETELRLLGACGFVCLEGNSPEWSWVYDAFLVRSAK